MSTRWKRSTSHPSGISLASVMVVPRAPSQSISWVSQSISSLMAFLQASSSFSASTSMCWYMGTKYLSSITNLGIGFLLLDFPTPHPPPNSVSRGGDWSAGSEGLQPELGEAVLAGGLIGHVVDDVVLGAGHAEEVCELVDHQPDNGILADAVGVDGFV